MTDAAPLAGAGEPSSTAPWPDLATRPGALGAAERRAGKAGPALRRGAAGKWLQPAFPWLAPHSLGLLAGAVLLGGVVFGVEALLGGPTAPVVSSAPVVRNQLRHLTGQLEECRGIESLLVMLANGPEREATLLRLQRQQKLIDTWFQSNGAWLAASHGAQALADLRDANNAWRALQQRVVQADVVPGRTGLANESRQLLTGPSAAAYRRMVQLVEGLAQRQPS